MKKFLSIVLGLTLSIQIAFANSIDRTIFQSGINKSAVSVSVKDTSTGKTVYKLNSKQPQMPASTLKLITLNAALDTLGTDYEFSTKLYKNNNNELFLKLGADPFLSSSDLNKIFEINVIEPKAILADSIKMGAPKIILAHNHPSGDCTPSKKDFITTEKIMDLAELFGIQLLDHIVIGDGKYASIVSELLKKKGC